MTKIIDFEKRREKLSSFDHFSKSQKYLRVIDFVAITVPLRNPPPSKQR